jgi:hypothetical protein
LASAFPFDKQAAESVVCVVIFQEAAEACHIPARIKISTVFFRANFRRDRRPKLGIGQRPRICNWYFGETK